MSQNDPQAAQAVNDATPTNAPEPTGATTELGADPPAHQANTGSGQPLAFLRRIVRRAAPVLRQVARQAAPLARRVGQQGVQLSRRLIAALRNR